MATIFHQGGFGTTSANVVNTPSYPVTFTPAADTLLVVFIGVSGNITPTENVVSNIGGLTFTKVPGSDVTNTDDLRKSSMWVANQLTTAVSTTISYVSNIAHTSGYVEVFGISGMSRVGLDAVRQIATAQTPAFNTAITATFPGPALTTNPLAIGFNATQGSGNPTVASAGWETVAGALWSTNSPASRYISYWRSGGFSAASEVMPSYGSPRSAVMIELDASPSGPVGANTPSTADTQVFEPMVPFAAADIVTKFSAALAVTPAYVVAGAAATSTVTRAPVLTTSVADPAVFAATPTAATATVSKVYTSVALPFAHATTLIASKDHVATGAAPFTHVPMAPADATGTKAIGIVNIESIALPAVYLATPSLATSSRQAYSIATPYTYSATPAATVSTAARVFISSADATVFAPLVPTPTNVNLTSAASPASFALVPSLIDVFFSGVTSLYCITDPTIDSPPGALRATNLPRALNNVAPGSAIEGTLSSFWGGVGNVVDRVVTSQATTAQQSHFFGRFTSRPLAAQTIHAQNWNYAFVVAAANLDANTYFWPVMYVWRPSTQQVVGHIFDAAANASTAWPATITTAPTRNIPGARVEAQEGDLLIVECWAVSTSSTGIARLQTWRMTANTSRIISQYKLLYKPTSILYFRADAPPVSPTAGEKATYLPLAQNVNWSGIANEGLLSETMVQAPVGRTISTIATTNPQSLYYGRHSSLPLAAQTIPAQNWGWEVSCGTTHANCHIWHWPVLYVWRPSTQQVVQYILNASADTGAEWRVGVDPLLNQQFAGESATVEAGDILVCEVWGVARQSAATSYGPMVWTTAINSSLVSPFKLEYYTGVTAITSNAAPATYELVEADATGTITLPTRALIETFQENFEAGPDPEKWTVVNWDGSVAFTGGVGVFTVTNGIAGAQALAESKPYFDLRGSGVFARLVQPFRQVGDPPDNDFSFGVKSPGNNTVAFSFSTSGRLRIIKFTNGVWGEVFLLTTSYFANVDAYRHLRISERAGTTYFESAPSTAANPPTEGQWVVRHSVATSTLPIDVSSCQFVAWVYTNSAGTVSQPAQIDGLNIATAPITAVDVPSVADPSSFALVPTATTARFGYASVAGPVLYAVSTPGTTNPLTRTTIALPGAFSQAYAPNTVDLAGYTSQAVPTTYLYSPTAATVSLGRVYASAALPPTYTFSAGFAGDTVTSFSIATPATYSAVYALSTTSIVRAAIAVTSAALPAEYTLAPQAATVSLGRVYTSAALPTSFFFNNTIEPVVGFARLSAATASAYSLGGVATTARFARLSIAMQAVYDTAALPATVSLGRVYTSVALPTSFFLNWTIETGWQFAHVTRALPATYTAAFTAATDTAIAQIVSIALEAVYSHTAPNTVDVITLAAAGAAQTATYTSIAHEAYAYVLRPSVALPVAFAGVVGTPTTTRAARVSYALPTEFNTQAYPTNIAGAAVVRHSSVAEPTTFKLSGAWGGSAVNSSSIATGITYSLAPALATATPSKNSIAVPANYAQIPSDTWSGRERISAALPATYAIASPATNSFASVKYVSAALPTSFLLTPTATGVRRGYATPAVSARYLQEGWSTADYADSEIKPPLVYPVPVVRPVLSDAQFDAWLSDERALRVTLIETKCIDAVTGVTELVYFASHGFVTKYEDGSPTFYAPLMRGGLDFAQTLDLDLSGNESYGDIELDNSTGELDWMFDRVWLYQEFKAYIGDAQWPRRDFRQIFDGTIEDIDSSQRDTVNVRLRDKLYRLEMPLHEYKMLGGGPNLDRLVPFTVGECHNITPLLSNANTLTYVWHPRSAEKNIEVRDNGIPVSFTEVVGGFTLAKQPYGRITCSVQGDRVTTGYFSTGYTNTVGKLVLHMMLEWGTEVAHRFTINDIDIDNFTAFEAANKYAVGLYSTERLTVRAACQQLAASVGARLTMTALGKAQLVKLQLPPPTTQPNLLFNGDFSSGMSGWSYSGTSGGIVEAASGINLNEVWYPPGKYVFWMRQDGSKNNQNSYIEYIGKAIPVEANKRYTISAYTGAHRCKVQIVFWEYSATGVLLRSSVQVPSAFNEGDFQGGNTMAAFKHVFDYATTGADTAYIRPLMRKWDTYAGAVPFDSYMFVTDVVIESSDNVNALIEVGESDMVSGSLHIADRLPIVPGARLGYCKNWTVQEDTAQGVPEDHKAMYAREWLSVLVTEPALRDKYEVWGEPEQENCLLLESASATTECSRRVNLRSTQRHIYEYIGFANLMFTPVGAPMKLTHRRFNLSGGKIGQVVSVAVNWQTSQVTIRVLI